MAQHLPDGSSVFYVGVIEATRSESGVWGRVRRSIVHAGVTVASQQHTTTTTTGGEVSFVLGDRQGSVTTTITGGEVTSRWYDPYGGRRGSEPVVDDRVSAGWLNQREDATGLVYLNNRYHDPVLGTFISVDPLVGSTGEPYGYGSGNPITFSDPSGLCTFISGRCHFGDGSTYERSNPYILVEPTVLDGEEELALQKATLAVFVAAVGALTGSFEGQGRLERTGTWGPCVPATLWDSSCEPPGLRVDAFEMPGSDLDTALISPGILDAWRDICGRSECERFVVLELDPEVNDVVMVDPMRRVPDEIGAMLGIGAGSSVPVVKQASTMLEGWVVFMNEVWEPSVALQESYDIVRRYLVGFEANEEISWDIYSEVVVDPVARVGSGGRSFYVFAG